MAVKGPRRSRRREDHWRRIVTRQPASGLSIRAWCQRQGVPEASFYAWRRTLAGRGVNGKAPVQASPVQLVALDVAGSAQLSVGGAPLHVTVADVRIEVRPGFDGETLARLLSVLRSGAAC
jgi:hypothetical protein